MALNPGQRSIVLSFINEVNMSKRRNPKKEKAQRNQAYARKFRKRQTTGRFSKFRRSRSPRSEEDEGAAQDNEGGSMNGGGGGFGGMD